MTEDRDDASSAGRGGHGEQPEVGAVGEEAAKLLGALAGWARDHGAEWSHGVSGLADHASRAAREVDDHLATGAAECTYCPICRTVHVLRQTSPEVRAHLATAATSLMQAAAGLLATAVPEQPERPRAGVEHIDLDDPADDTEWAEEAPDPARPDDGDGPEGHEEGER